MKRERGCPNKPRPDSFFGPCKVHSRCIWRVEHTATSTRDRNQSWQGTPAQGVIPGGRAPAGLACNSSLIRIAPSSVQLNLLPSVQFPSLHGPGASCLPSRPAATESIASSGRAPAVTWPTS